METSLATPVDFWPYRTIHDESGMTSIGVHSGEIGGQPRGRQTHSMTTPRIRTMVLGRNAFELAALQSAMSAIDTCEVVATADSAATAVVLMKEARPELIVVDRNIPLETVMTVLGSGVADGVTALGSFLEGEGLKAVGIAGDDLEFGRLPGIDRQANAPAWERDGIDRGDGPAKKLAPDDPIILKLNEKYHVVRVRSILAVSSARHYTYVVTREGFKGVTSKSMKEWEERLPAKVFARIHRNTIINLECVEHIDTSGNAAYHVSLKGLDKPVSMSHRSFARIRRQFN